jgi:hypothetical protein
MSKITLDFMERFMGNLDTAIRTFVGNKLNDKQDLPTLMSQVMNVGSTSVTFIGIPTTGVQIVDIYTSKAGLDYVSIDDSTAGSLTVNYEAQTSAVTVYLKIERYTS